MHTTNSSLFILFELPLLLILYSAELTTSSTCLTRECGGIEIPFPFGIGENCYLDKVYEIECRRKTTTSREHVPFLSIIDKEVVDISHPYGASIYHTRRAYGQLRVKNVMTSTGVSMDRKDCGSLKDLTDTPFFCDGVNKLAAVGLPNSTNSEDLFANGRATLSLGWIIQTNNNSFISSLACKDSKNYTNYSAEHNTKCLCDQSTTSNITYGNCVCNSGYEGNPYLRGECVDINECEDPDMFTCNKGETCKNIPGYYQCVKSKTKPIFIGFGVLVLVAGLWWLRKLVVKRRLTERKKAFFKRNGGLLLKQELNTRNGNVEKTRIFSSRELEKATENFSANRVLGQGGQGTVYKGMLLDGRTVAVKKSKAINEDRLQEFINEVMILSQINHRHVVKLLGCCLETEVPILVYELILNGNLFQHIHEEFDDYTVTWTMRLRIAVDAAGALSYLHSSASSPIYHRDIKSANILLDEKYRAKVSDFGTSRSITIDQTHWTTGISGTYGYVDPEYYQSSHYTEKSDVYSFGVVLAELITGDKPVITVQNTQEVMSLATHFRLAMKERRFFDIMDSRLRDNCKVEQVKAVAHLTMKCLSSKGKNRPNMREVFTELERISTSPDDSKLQIHTDDEEEEEHKDVMKILKRGKFWSVGFSAPASSMMLSSSSLEVESLFPRLTW